MPVKERPRALAPVLLMVFSVGLTLAAMEIVLRSWPLLLGDTFANGVLTRYGSGEGQIYYHDNRLGMPFMIPNYETEMYYNRYVWRHRTDAHGFRNERPSIPADVVLLGDSFIYGHGVNVEDTVAHYLAQATGWTVANLGRQGDCAFQEAYILTEFLPVYRPRWVVYFFFENDLADLHQWVDEATMRRFAASDVAAIIYPPRTPLAVALAEHERILAARPWYQRLWDRSYVVKMVRWALSTVGVRPAFAGGSRHITEQFRDPASLP